MNMYVLSFWKLYCIQCSSGTPLPKIFPSFPPERVDPDETLQNAASYQGLYYLPLIQQFLDTISGSKLYLFNRRGRQHSFVEIDREIFSTVILSLPLIQEGHLSVSGERICTMLVNCLEDMTPLGLLGRKTSAQTKKYLFKLKNKFGKEKRCLNTYDK